MPPRQEIVASLYAAWRIAMLDPDAMRYFNLSADGFWRSFFALVLVAPPYLLIIALNYGDLTDEGRDVVLVWYVIVQALVYVLGWALFAVAMIPVSRLLGRASHYVPFIIAWNWANVIQILVLLPPLLLSVLVSQGFGVLLFAVWLAVLYYGYRVARASLECDALTGIIVIAFDLVLSLLIDRLADLLY